MNEYGIQVSALTHIENLKTDTQTKNEQPIYKLRAKMKHYYNRKLMGMKSELNEHNRRKQLTTN